MKTSSKLYKLQHAEALDITKEFLDEVINNQKQIKQKLQKNSTPNIAKANNAPKPPTPGGAKTSSNSTPSTSSPDSGDSSHEFSDFISISADERSNAILVYGTKRRYRRNWKNDFLSRRASSIGSNRYHICYGRFV